MSRTWKLIRRTATVLFFLILVLPIALMTSVRPWMLAAVSGGIGVMSTIAFLTTRGHTRPGFRAAGEVFVIAALVLTALHVSRALEPMYERTGWLLLRLTAEVAPYEVAPGDTLTFTLSTTNSGDGPARVRPFVVDGTPHSAVLVYGILPDLGYRYFHVRDASAELTGRDGNPLAPVTVAYATPFDFGYNPAYWEWTTTYTPEATVIGALTSDGVEDRELAVGETLRLTYDVAVPVHHPAGTVHQKRAGLSYRDPQWATYISQDLWFPFEQELTVTPATP